MDLQTELLTEIEAYVRARGMAETTFGRTVANDGKFVGRLRAGKGITVRLVERVRKYMQDNPAEGASQTNGEAA